MPRRPVIAIFGPTGIGKTDIAIELADLLRAEGTEPVAISVDSMQVYRELPVLTGAATTEQQTRLEHKLVAIVSVTEEHDVVTHAALAHRAIDQALDSGRCPIVVGGTGLYLRAALTDLDFLPPPLPGRREDLERRAATEGLDVLLTELEALDPGLAAAVDRRNSRRVIRALETAERGRATGARAENRLWTSDVRVPTKLYALTMDRQALYARINTRIDEMLAAGAEAEVAAARAAGIGATAAQALGVEELTSGDLEAFKTNTRRYAKRQLTWLAKLAGATTIDVTGRDSAEIAGQIAASASG
jgi:tRNA dimethylallyltransferase